jgi:hypothetical protein
MFGLFKSPTFRDPGLGELVRSRGHWRGTPALAGANRVALALAGSRSEPDPQALAAARDVPHRMAEWRASIEAALFEHYEPYGDSIADASADDGHEAGGQNLPKLATAPEVWPHVSLEFISVTPLDGVLTVELGYAAAWDEEHTLGARFQANRFIELCGSVLPA